MAEESWLFFDDDWLFSDDAGGTHKTVAQQADELFWKKVAAGEMHTMASVRRYAQVHYPGRYKQWLKQHGYPTRNRQKSRDAAATA